jgi:hypothetical protein
MFASASAQLPDRYGNSVCTPSSAPPQSTGIPKARIRVVAGVHFDARPVCTRHQANRRYSQTCAAVSSRPTGVSGAEIGTTARTVMAIA